MAKKKNTATLRLRVWIEQEKETYIGIGSTLLLQHIEELGSLRKAAEALGMSYRRAWGKLKNAEARIGLPLVEKIKGQGQRFNLTPAGKEIMEKFLHFYLDVEAYATQRASEVLNMDIKKSGEFYRDDTGQCFSTAESAYHTTCPKLGGTDETYFPGQRG